MKIKDLGIKQAFLTRITKRAGILDEVLFETLPDGEVCHYEVLFQDGERKSLHGEVDVEALL